MPQSVNGKSVLPITVPQDSCDMPAHCMSKVVQMLEGVCDVPQPPISSHIGYRLYANAFKSSSEEGTSSGMSDYNSDALLSAVRLSGPR